ncbi:MDR family MFS transporter [Paenibacillus koleovorans]|uniref:MDR family MFS transporter n=1 Tax=Paenibacillus koleovorans TaxID=121608 RepID=UPI000FDAA5F7|nr:MDR family MFS transporter [Paenibacillus koleovorans]
MEHLDHRTKVTIMISIMAAMLFAALNQTIVGTALPRIIAELGGLEYYSWVFTIYMLTSSVTTILVGKLSDMYGRKPFILIGISIFILGSFLSGTSASIIQLIVYRGIQGFGAGMIMSTAFASIGDLFAPRERGRWQGLMSASFGLASVFGPTLGGYIVDHYEWHWVFWVFLPVGLIAMGLIWWLFPQVPRKEKAPIDYVGSICLTLTIVPMLLAFSWAGTKYEWGSVEIAGLFVAAVAALMLFVLVERRVSNPVLPIGLFRIPAFTLSNAAGFLMGSGMFGAVMFVPFYVQGVKGMTATHSGFVTMPMTLSLVIMSALGGQWISRTGKYKGIAILGMVMMTVGLLSMSFMTGDTPVWLTVLLLILVGGGVGFGMPVFTLTVQNSAEPRLLGVATASSQLFRSLGGTIGVSIMGTVLGHRIGVKMKELAATAGDGASASMPPETAEKLQALQDPQLLLDPPKLEQLRLALPESLQATFREIVAQLHESLGYALSGVFLTGAFIVAGALILSFFLKEVTLRSGKRKQEDTPPTAPAAAPASVSTGVAQQAE